MFFTLIRLQYLKSIRSTSFAKSALATGFLVFVALLLLSYVFFAGLFLGRIIDMLAEGKEPIAFLNSHSGVNSWVETIFTPFKKKSSLP